MSKESAHRFCAKFKQSLPRNMNAGVTVTPRVGFHSVDIGLLDLLFVCYEGPAKSFVTGFVLLQCYVLSNIFLLQTFIVFLLY